MNEGVRIRLTGRMPERFVEKALAEGVRFRSIERESTRVIRMETDPAGAKAVQALADRYGVRAELLGLTGLTALRRRLRARLTLLSAAAVCATVLGLFSACYWRVEVRPLDGDAGADAVRSYLAQAGISAGVAREKVDEDALRDRLLADFPNLSYVGVSARGAVLTVETAHEAPPPGLYDAGAACDLVARRDAVILSITPLAGTACVKPGDTVRRGQRLILGEERISREETRGVRALGEVIGRYWHEGRCTISLTREETGPTGRARTESRLELLGLGVRLTEAQPFTQEEALRAEIPLGGLFLPLKIIRITHRETKTRTERLTREQAEALAAARATEEAMADCSPEETVIRSWVAFAQENEHSITARAVVEVTADISAAIQEVYDWKTDSSGN